jgi:hypothetical protein
MQDEAKFKSAVQIIAKNKELVSRQSVQQSQPPEQQQQPPQQ